MFGARAASLSCAGARIGMIAARTASASSSPAAARPARPVRGVVA